LCRNGPAFNTRFEEVGIAKDEVSGQLVTADGKELSRTYQRCNMGCQCRWRVSPGLLPTVLRSHRPFTDEKSARTADHLIRIEVAERATLPQSQCQDDREGYFVQLHPLPVGTSIDPEILVETAVVALRYRQVDQGPQGRAQIANCKQAAGALHH